MSDNSQQDDWELLRAYVERGSEAAFEAIVRRYAAHVHSVSLRRTANPDLAQDVTQAVFLLLTKKAPDISRKTVLLGWLTNTARFVSQTAIRTERRRVYREVAAMKDPSLNSTQSSAESESAWHEVAPHIDEALAALKEIDRNVILLRFYQKQSVEQIGRVIGAGESATQKRISRAVEKLRKILVARGITISCGGLLASLSTAVCEAAPAGLEAFVMQSVSLKGATTVSPAVASLVDASLKEMAIKAISKGTLVAVSVLAIAVPTTTLLLPKSNASLQIYDLSRDFSHTENPNGAWAFGWAPEVGGLFRPIQFRKSVGVEDGVLIQSWQFGRSSNPAIYKNSGEKTWDNGQGVFPAGAVWFHGGDNGQPQNFGVIRYTVPYGGSGQHKVMVAVAPHFHAAFAGDADFYIATNGVAAAAKVLDTKSSFGWTNSFELNQGQTIDFSIGRGADGDEYASGLRIQIVIESPKPKATK